MAVDLLRNLSIRELLMLITIKKTGLTARQKLYDAIFLEDEDIDAIIEDLAKKGYVEAVKGQVILTSKGSEAASLGDDLVDKIVMDAVDYGKNVEEVFGFTPVLPYILNEYTIDVGIAFHVFMEWLEKFYGSQVSDDDLDAIITEMETIGQ
ncbi:MAG: hypothetical protein F7B20_04355 [Aeropyrum sp.]|nr:hypothetical protein [Aeropyrum sp.]MCE4615461.1 hypothetical protein [Aeropyrum sp.]